MDPMESGTPEPFQSDRPPDSTGMLLARIRDGDSGARAQLVSRYLPALTRIAHGRLPARARGRADTNDLVQTTLLRALGRLDAFECRREGAFLAYLRTILLNQIRDEIRAASRTGWHEELSDDFAGSDPTPSSMAIGRQVLEAYDSGLSRLRSKQREAVILKLEFGLDYDHIAQALELPSPNAARLVITRALVRLTSHMRGLGHARS